MNQPQIFNFEHNEVRTFLENDVPYFVANDVAKTLGYKNPSKATNDHCKKAIETWGNDSLGRRQKFKIIPESDVYRLIIKSNLPSAEKFESWVMEEVLPQIRKHGMYATDELLNNPDLLIEVATKLKEERTLRLIAEQQVNELQPKA
ncbi:BRO-N domain-containing protein, partial [Enterococcus faecium]